MKFSSKIEKCGLSPMRKFAPYANEAAKKGKKLYHLNIGQPDLPSPKEGLESLKHIDRKVLEYSMSDLASADRAAVEEQLAAGVSAAEAEALYLTDEYFENWYQSLCTKLSAYEG